MPETLTCPRVSLPAVLEPRTPASAAPAPGTPGRAEALETMSIVTTAAVRGAAEALSEMVLRPIEAVSAEVRMVSLSHVAMLAGDPERPVFAAYLGVRGEVTGHILLAFGETMAHTLIDLLLDQPPGTTTELGDMEVSALAEAGNVAGSRFLTTLADWAGLAMPPTPPVVVHEMRGAILDTLAAELAFQEHEQAVVIDAQFTCDGRAVEASFFVFPDEAMVAAVGEGRGREVPA